MSKIFIGVGSNLGDRASYLEFAKAKLLCIAGLTDLRCSPVYETEPVAVEGGLFLNAVWSFEADLSLQDLLKKIQEIEAEANRQRNRPHSPTKDLKVNGTSPGNLLKKKDRGRDRPSQARTLDLDILFYGSQVVRGLGVIVPHPRLHDRAFVLVPFCDLAPEWVHPVLKKRMKEILKGLNAGKRGAGNIKQIRSAFPVNRFTEEK